MRGGGGGWAYLSPSFYLSGFVADALPFASSKGQGIMSRLLILIGGFWGTCASFMNVEEGEYTPLFFSQHPLPTPFNPWSEPIGKGLFSTALDLLAHRRLVGKEVFAVAASSSTAAGLFKTAAREGGRGSDALLQTAEPRSTPG